MKRALFLALLLAAAPALAADKLLIVYDEVPNYGVGLGSTICDSIQEASRQMVMEGLANWEAYLQRRHVSYTKLPATYVKTEQARIGIVSLYGGAVVDTFGAVIHFAMNGSAGTVAGRACHADSLTRALRHGSATAITNGPSVPQCMVFRPTPHGQGTCDAGVFDQGGIMFPGSTRSTPSSDYTQIASATICSTAVVHGWVYNDNPEDPLAGATSVVVRSTLTGKTWVSAANFPTVRVGPAGAPGGLRIHLQSFDETGGEAKHAAGQQELYPDSIYTTGLDEAPEGAEWDTVSSALMWERRYSTIANAAPIIFTNYWGQFPCNDTLWNYIPCEGGNDMIAHTVARLDSLVRENGGTGLIPAGEPADKAAVMVLGLCSRAGRRHYAGLSPSDTSSFWESLRIMKRYGIPAAFGVNAEPESMRVYASDLTRTISIMGNLAKFFPLSRYGLNGQITLTPGRTTAGRGVLVDVGGKSRSRTFLGDWTGQGKDSSFASLLFFQRDTLADYVGKHRLARVYVANDDDYSFANFGSIANAMDSLAIVLNDPRLGIDKMVVDGQVIDVSTQAAASRKGWINPYQGEFRAKIAPARLALLAHTGYSITGGEFQNDFGYDSTSFGYQTCCLGFSTAIKTGKMLSRATVGIFGRGGQRDYDYFPFDGKSDSWEATNTQNSVTLSNTYYGVNTSPRDYVYKFQRASVLRFGCNDLAGSDASPVMPGTWAIKGLAAMSGAMNALAGRPTFALVQLDELP